MLNILTNLTFQNKPSIHSINKEQNAKILPESDKNQCKNTIYYPTSTKE